MAPRGQSGKTLKIVVACTERMVCAGLAALLEREPGFTVSGQATDCAMAARQVVTTRANVLLLDLQVLASDGQALFARLRDLPGKPRVILLSTRADERHVLDALRRGAWGVVLKDASPGHLVRSIRTAAGGEAWVDRETVSRLLESIHRPRAAAPAIGTPRLSPRALEIICEVADGATNADIARKLGLSQQTVKNHLQQIFDKVGVSSRLELALYAVSHALTDANSTKVPLA